MSLSLFIFSSDFNLFRYYICIVINSQARPLQSLSFFICPPIVLSEFFCSCHLCAAHICPSSYSCLVAHQTVSHFTHLLWISQSPANLPFPHLDLFADPCLPVRLDQIQNVILNYVPVSLSIGLDRNHKRWCCYLGISDKVTEESS